MTRTLTIEDNHQSIQLNVEATRLGTVWIHQHPQVFGADSITEMTPKEALKLSAILSVCAKEALKK